jgi:hypothetical protein
MIWQRTYPTAKEISGANTTDLKRKISLLKIHVDQLEDWCMQCMNLIYEIEEKILDQEETHIDELFSNWRKSNEPF